jgi:hypothetical protein
MSNVHRTSVGSGWDEVYGVRYAPDLVASVVSDAVESKQQERNKDEYK